MTLAGDTAETEPGISREKNPDLSRRWEVAQGSCPVPNSNDQEGCPYTDEENLFVETLGH